MNSAHMTEDQYSRLWKYPANDATTGPGGEAMLEDIEDHEEDFPPRRHTSTPGIRPQDRVYPHPPERPDGPRNRQPGEAHGRHSSLGGAHNKLHTAQHAPTNKKAHASRTLCYDPVSYTHLTLPTKRIV